MSFYIYSGYIILAYKLQAWLLVVSCSSLSHVNLAWFCWSCILRNQLDTLYVKIFKCPRQTATSSGLGEWLCTCRWCRWCMQSSLYDPPTPRSVFDLFYTLQLIRTFWNFVTKELELNVTFGIFDLWSVVIRDWKTIHYCSAWYTKMCNHTNDILGMLIFELSF